MQRLRIGSRGLWRAFTMKSRPLTQLRWILRCSKSVHID
ncbi:hypothetical protein Pint_26007 [Pistacia integerrima]|uniref:Uncharacterized protein n=1 Tax=Pistacia integerrima TaxID=434235 RepID=A0ACC0YHK2_9ROSI|nr:hypothetical protein Pint_26007 [Pistacia integerrima]